MEREIGKLIQPIKDGVSATSIKKGDLAGVLFFIGPAFTTDYEVSESLVIGL